MEETTPETNRRDPTLDPLIKILEIAKGTCGIPLAQAAFASVSVLLTTIKVRSLLSHHDKFPIHVYYRTKLPANKTMFNSASPAPVYVKLWTGD